jgi:hypothetical protein
MRIADTHEVWTIACCAGEWTAAAGACCCLRGPEQLLGAMAGVPVQCRQAALAMQLLTVALARLKQRTYSPYLALTMLLSCAAPRAR